LHKVALASWLNSSKRPVLLLIGFVGCKSFRVVVTASAMRLWWILLVHFFFLPEDVMPMQVMVEVSGLTISNLSFSEFQIKICEGLRWEFIVASCVWCLVSL
jgi:hypothetical protein